VPCSERDRIAEQFADAVKAYSEAVNGLRALRGYEFTQHQQLVEQARIACEAVRRSCRTTSASTGVRALSRKSPLRDAGSSLIFPTSSPQVPGAAGLNLTRLAANREGGPVEQQVLALILTSTRWPFDS
jgi:hypothetical protein